MEPIDISSANAKEEKLEPCHLPRLSMSIPTANVQWEAEELRSSMQETMTTCGLDSSTREGSSVICPYQEATMTGGIEDSLILNKRCDGLASANFNRMRQRR